MRPVFRIPILVISAVIIRKAEMLLHSSVLDSVSSQMSEENGVHQRSCSITTSRQNK